MTTGRPRMKPRRKGETSSDDYNRNKALQEAGQRERAAAEKRAAAAEKFLQPVKRTRDVLSELVREAPFTGEAYQQAAENQRQEKVLKWHDINTGFEAALTAQLMTDLGYPLIKGGFNWLKNKAISPAARLMMNPENFVFEGPLIKPITINVPSLEETLKSLQPSLGGSLVELLPRKPLTGLPQPKLQLRLPAYDAHAQLSIAPQDAGLTDVTDGDLFGIRLADTALKRPIKVSPHDMPSELFENLSGHSAESAANNLYQQYIENLPFWQSRGVRPPLPYITSVGDESLSVGFRPQWYKMIGTPNTLQKVAELPAGLPESVVIKRLPEPARYQLDSMMGYGTDFDLFDEWLGPEAMSQSLLENRALATQAFNDIADRARFNVNVSTLKDNGLISGRHAAALKHTEDPSKYWSWGVEKSALRKAVPQYFKDIKLAKQKDYAKRVIEARKLEESVNAGLNDRAYAVYSDLQGSIKPPQSLNSLINDANQTIGLIRSIGDIVEDTFKNYQAWKADPNPAGWLLKPLMAGNKLERQLSKDGTIAVSNLRNGIKDASGVEKLIIEKVLSEKFAGQTKVNYTDLKHAVQEELPIYNHDRTHAYESYGLDRLGFDLDTYVRGSVTFGDLERNFPGRFVTSRDPLFKITDTQTGKILKTQEDLDEYVDLLNNNNRVLLDTYTFNSPRIPHGNNRHYSQNTLGHSRTYISKEEPDVMHVMESQSDWGLQYKRLHLEGTADAELERVYERLNDKTHSEYLANNWESRLIQENMMHAAGKGLTKMRYPTSDTAAKIEGYSKRFGTRREMTQAELDEYYSLSEFVDKAGRDRPRLTRRNSENMDEVIKQRDAWDVLHPEWVQANRRLEEINNTIAENNGRRILIYDQASSSYSPEHQTILRKYSEFPKKFKKIYKNSEVREVTDSKGNTWYEVDVPKDMKKRERAYSIAGTVIAGGTAASTIKPRKK